MFRNFLVTAYRNLVSNKRFTLLNVFGLVTGVVVFLLIGVWLQRELSFDNFHPDANNTFRITNTFKSESETFSQAPSGVALGAQLPKLLPVIKASCRVFNFEYKVKVGNTQSFESKSLLVDSNFFTFFGFSLKQGQPKTVLQSPDQVVLSEATAIKYFGRSEAAVGKTIMLDDQTMVVAGIAENTPPNSHLQYDIIVPYAHFRNWALINWKENLDDQWVGGWPYTYVQLTDPQKRQQAEKQVNAVVAEHSAKDWKDNKMSYQYFLNPIRDIHLKSNLRYDAVNNGSLSTVKIFSVVSIIVLLLACINYINLTTAGAIKRAKETSIRKVVGATKGQLIRQFFSETFLFCAISVTLGIFITKAILPSFSTWIGQPYDLPITFKTISISIVLIIVLSAIAGFYPAAILSSFNPAISLKGNFSQSKHGNIIRKTLVVFQFTITIALAASILIITQQMNFIKNKSLGFNDNAILHVNFNGDQKAIQRFALLRNELLKNPYVLNASKHDGNIVGGLGNGWTTTQNSKGEEVSTSIYRLSVDADYFDTYEMKLAAGRAFSKDIPTDTAKSVLINQAAAKIFGWQTPESAIGKPFGKGKYVRYVIGVVKDFNFESLHKSIDPLLIGYASTENANGMSLKINAAHSEEAIRYLTKTWEKLIPEVPLQYGFVDERIAAQYNNEQKMQGIFLGFSGLSLLIACLGLFGLSTFIVERKLKEIGIRKVLGASVSGIVTLLSKDFLRLVLLSLLIATPLAWYFMHNWLQDFAYRIELRWWIFLIPGLFALLIAFGTISFQTIRAALANPIKSLRTE